VSNRRSFIESPADVYGNESSWPLTGSTATSYTSVGAWPSLEKSLPPTPRSRGVSLSRRVTEDYTSHQRPEFQHRMSEPPIQRTSLSRPASWNPRCNDIPPDFDLNLDRAILGTSLARDHRLKKDETVEEQQAAALESIFNTLRLSSDPLSRHYSWTNTSSDDRKETLPSQIQHPPSNNGVITDAQRQRQVTNRIVSERNLNPSQFDTNPKHARFFVIKSYNVTTFLFVCVNVA
jgi:hypothetical protein